MKKILIFIFLFFLVLFSKVSAGSILKINPSADATIKSDHVTQNFGSTNILSVSHDSSTTASDKLFLKFDISSIPKGATINTATILLSLQKCDGDLKTLDPANNKILVEKVTGSWNENTIKWNNAPSLSTIGNTFRVATCNSLGSLWGFDIKDILESWILGSPNYGVALFNESAVTYERSFYSKENSSNKPFLEITYSQAVSSSSALSTSNSNSSTISSTAISSSISSNSTNSESSQKSSNITNNESINIIYFAIPCGFIILILLIIYLIALFKDDKNKLINSTDKILINKNQSVQNEKTAEQNKIQ